MVHALKPDRGIGVTAIDKRAVTGPVKVTKSGLYADVQADRVHHGGFDQAIYAYSNDEAARWASELGREIPAGFFGENLRVSGLQTTDAIVGERWRIGRDVVVEVTLPRTPCSTFARHMDEEAWVSRFTDRGDVGCYLKVRSRGQDPCRGSNRADLDSRPRRQRARGVHRPHGRAGPRDVGRSGRGWESRCRKKLPASSTAGLHVLNPCQEHR